MSEIDRRRFLQYAALGTGALLQPGSANAARDSASPSARPNILLLLADDLRADAIHAFGGNPVQTPNIDRLAQEGASFTRACIMGSMQPAVCMPSRGMLLTGRNLFHLPKEFAGEREIPCISMPEHFRDAGYATFFTGKWHNDRKALARGFETGEAVFLGGMSDHFNIRLCPFDPSGAFAESAAYTGQGHSSEIFADAAVRFLNEYDGDRPFFAYVPFTAPHDPRQSPQEYGTLYKADDMPLPSNFMPQHPFDNGELGIRDELLAPPPRTPEEVRKHIAAYFAMITHLDVQIGRILEALGATGRDKNTLVVFASDNGLALGSHGLLGKQSLYEHSVRVPLIVRGPGIKPGLHTNSLCYLHDIFPTLCELSGTTTPGSVESQSLAPLLLENNTPARTTLFHAYRDVQRAVTTSRWKLIRYHVDGQNATQLFDLENDPWELDNLANTSAGREKVHELDQQLQDWMPQIEDTQKELYPPLAETSGAS